MKFVHKNSDENHHWLWCEKNKVPYIVIGQFNEGLNRIFYDVTNLEIPLEEVSDSLRIIYDAYLTFFMIPVDEVSSVLDDYYLFSIIVKTDHAEYIAGALFDYIKQKYIDVV